MRFKKIALFFLLSISIPAFSDSWGPPQAFSVKSENGLFKFEVKPESAEKKAREKFPVVLQEFSPTVEETLEPSEKNAVNKIAPSSIDPSIESLPESISGNHGSSEDSQGPSSGSLYRIGENGAEEMVWQRQLVNPAMPLRAIISSSGEFVVTFDEYGGADLNGFILAVYGNKGRFLRKFKLSDILSNQEINTLPISTTSIHWFGSARFEQKGDDEVLVLITKAANKRLNLTKLAEGTVEIF